MRKLRRSAGSRQLVFRTAPWVPVPPKSVAVQATRGALAEGFVAAALHPIDGLVLRATLSGGAASATASSVRLFTMKSLLHAAGGAAAGAAAFALAYAGLCHAMETRGKPELALVAAGTASLLSTVVDAPLRVMAAGAQMDRIVSGAAVWGATARDIPNDAVEFGSYELFRSKVDVGTGFANRLLSGALSGILATLVVAPIDASIAHMLARPNRKMVGAFLDVWRAGGVKALYAGAGRRVGREAIASALFFVVYDDGDDDDDN